MRIDPNSDVNGGQGANAVNHVSTSNSAQAARPLQSTVQDSGDRANLSSDALQLSNLSSALASVPSVRQDRVAAVTQAIQNGNYAVSNRQIAQSLVRDFRSTSVARS